MNGISHLCYQTLSSGWVCSEEMLVPVGIVSAVTAIGFFGICYARACRNKQSFPLFSSESSLEYSFRKDLFSNVAKYLTKEEFSTLNEGNKITHSLCLRSPHFDQNQKLLSQFIDMLEEVERLEGLPEDIRKLPREICNILTFREFLKCRSTLQIWYAVANKLQNKKSVPPSKYFLDSLEDYQNAAMNFKQWAHEHGVAESCQELSLSGKAISDITALTSLPGLRKLNLSQNQIINISALSDLAKLKKLKLGLNQIRDVSSLKDLRKLTKLELHKNHIIDISALADLAKLKKLKLGLNQIRDVSSLKDLRKLTKLELHNNHITNISALKDLAKLKRLALYDNPIRGIQLWEDSRLGDLNLLTERFHQLKLRKKLLYAH